MSNSEKFDALDEKHERNRQQRLAAIKRWADYITDNPADVWGPQQNAVVNAQLESASAADLGVEHERRVREFAESIDADRPDDGGDS